MKLLLHTCCAPCSAYCIKSLRDENIEPTLYWYNPNIHPYTEYVKRRDCLKEYTKKINVNAIFEDEYGLENFCKNTSNNLQTRCIDYCYPIRLNKTFEYAKKNGYDAVSTTLLYSIYQKHDFIKKYMEKLSEKYEIDFLYRDFRKGFWIGQEMAKEMNLYMQKYCGCIFSLDESIRDKSNHSKPKLTNDFEFLPAEKNIVIKKERNNKEQYIKLLLESDPNEDEINSYLNNGDVYILIHKSDVVCVAVVTKINENIVELNNIVTKKEYRNNGYGKKMIKYLSDNYKQKYNKMLIGTTENNIPFFVKQGFENYIKTIKNYFDDTNYNKNPEKKFKYNDKFYYSKDLKN